MDLSDITTALSDAAPYAGAITALANLGIDITKLVSPDQNYDQQFQDRCAKAGNLVSALVQNPSPDTERAINAFDDELCAATGRPLVGGISVPTVTIRVDRWLAKEADSAELILYRQLFATLGGGKQQAAAPAPSPTPLINPIPVTTKAAV